MGVAPKCASRKTQDARGEREATARCIMLCPIKTRTPHFFGGACVYHYMYTVYIVQCTAPRTARDAQRANAKSSTAVSTSEYSCTAQYTVGTICENLETRARDMGWGLYSHVSAMPTTCYSSYTPEYHGTTRTRTYVVLTTACVQLYSWLTAVALPRPRK